MYMSRQVHVLTSAGDLYSFQVCMLQACSENRSSIMRIKLHLLSLSPIAKLTEAWQQQPRTYRKELKNRMAMTVPAMSTGMTDTKYRKP